ncbi:hypothetical protein [Acinetobacter baumannii]
MEYVDSNTLIHAVHNRMLMK